MQTIGERLEDARKRKGVSIREAADATKIRSDCLQKFESNQFDIGLTEIYVHGFLRNYATVLHLPADRILNDFAALGGGEVRPRQPSRKVYGRMDLSVASAEDRRNECLTAPEPEPISERAVPMSVRALRGPDGTNGWRSASSSIGRNGGIESAELCPFPIKVDRRPAQSIHCHHVDAGPVVRWKRCAPKRPRWGNSLPLPDARHIIVQLPSRKRGRRTPHGMGSSPS